LAKYLYYPLDQCSPDERHFLPPLVDGGTWMRCIWRINKSIWY
jgi:hypothetical protein